MLSFIDATNVDATALGRGLARFLLGHLQGSRRTEWEAMSHQYKELHQAVESKKSGGSVQNEEPDDCSGRGIETRRARMWAFPVISSERCVMCLGTVS